jgi:hypothetical protein
MCVSGMPGAQSCKCSCEVTFSQPKHSFVIMVATVCTENSILIDYVTESPNLSGDDLAALLFPDPVRVTVQVEEST